jgi:DNA (cytosine-5)-methyltransferase 1
VTAQRFGSVDVSRLVLSLFPGIDLLGRGFEEEGFCVVRGPDLIFGGDVRRFHAPAGRFDGVIGGSPCPDFSRARRTAPSGEGVAMLNEFRRVVTEAASAWWLLENVPACPDLQISGYSHQRIDLDARDCGLKQRRLRHFQYGSRDGVPLVLPRQVTRSGGEATCMATEGNKADRRGWEDFCELQGLPRDFDLPGFTRGARYRAVGNGVPPPMGAMIARAIAHPLLARVCSCGCARPVAGNLIYAGAACRKRAQRKRDAAGVGRDGSVTGESGRVTGVTDQAA